jgi:hypothetical protein
MRFAVPVFAEASVREADQALGVLNPPVTIERGDRFKSRRSRHTY